MNTCDLSFGGATFQAFGSGALWWADLGILIVSDLHLGKSDRIARRGGAFLPPYETAETLDRLSQDIATTNPKTIISLGDSFDDDLSVAALTPEQTAQTRQWTEAYDWIWISGNHDPAPKALGGHSADEVQSTGIVFRHIARDDLAGGYEVSGHFHPKLRLQTRAGSVSRAAFVWDDTRMLLPAYGAYTGGLDIAEPAIKNLFNPPVTKAILTGSTPISVPAYSAASPSKRRRGPTGPLLRHRRGSSG